MLTLTGYADRLSVIAGQSIRFHVANQCEEKPSAKLIRVLCADPNPEIGGVRYEYCDVPIRELSTPKAQSVPLGSYARLGPEGLLATASSFTFCLHFQARLQATQTQVICSNLDDQHAGFSLALNEQRHLILQLMVNGQTLITPLSQGPIELQRWYRIQVVLDGTAKRLSWLIRERWLRGATSSGERHFDEVFSPGTKRALSLASASAEKPAHCFNGRIEDPWFIAQALPMTSELDLQAAAAHPNCIAAWDFSLAMQTQSLIDISAHQHHGALVNTPTRAVRGAQWTGKEQCFRHAPRHYAAIHFHQDDLDDCRWPATHEISIPENFPSDAYALLLTTHGLEENIPFFVVPPQAQPSAKIAVLVSTYTYTVYGNHARPEWFSDSAWREAYIEQASDWRAYPHNPGEHQDYGLSTYNTHPDGSGVGLVSWRRPMLNLRMGYITYPYPEIRASGLRHYPADSHLLMWLKHHRLAYDLITDEELHREGLNRLSAYQTVLTGTHPEYHTETMLNALKDYRDQGGKLIYLGGNGFYWKVALDPSREGIIEVRRAEGGIRAWAAEAGEYFHQFDGEYGGLWRRNARPPQELVGVGFTAQGNFVGSYYRIKQEARSNPAVSWILEGIENDIIGAEGFSGHGAAGFELDRVDERQGSPSSAVVIASSEHHPPEAPWVLVPEEHLTHITTIPGKSHKELIRADMTYFDGEAGGAVFSVGSITFCGSLPVNHFNNDCSKILYNVVKRFTDA
ncbi:MAG: N,N-dimethylformamidase large subunit [Betaproteobacteria bacterium]|jgi:N,N-dimethylformamidase|nr:N,N-dimethylformamidase large subunit [Pseudomonadota bacterium]NBO94682.1 N,N-dimethylformamidase large subunit [Betaproteobacteria bacterium]NBP34954.1 N,N-dimethylformamidase large subunit [Betaproteobacteria bacterium]NBP37338.1 N,N-dimethylformamidase large subunit [Betaproteobacteria bacterium]NBQ78583.1 N,N-dimethylformamidase large subunit [Betaproteobacteria bacterium]